MYGFSITFPGTFDEALVRIPEALQTEGFGILTEIDVQVTLKKKIDVDRLPYRILGACNPMLANQAINAEPDIGLLLPCNVIVRQEEDGAVIIGFMDPIAVMKLVERPEVVELATEVRTRLERVRDLLAG